MDKKRIAMFQGSFDPFTRGHESIVLRALSVFDEVVVVVVRNSLKRYYFSEDLRRRIIESAFASEPRVRVVVSDKMSIDAAREVGACCLLRGVRSVADFEYEMGIAEVNRQQSGLETLLLYTLPQYSHISSTIVREWIKWGKDMTSYLPAGMAPSVLREVLATRHSKNQ